MMLDFTATQEEIREVTTAGFRARDRRRSYLRLRFSNESLSVGTRQATIFAQSLGLPIESEDGVVTGLRTIAREFPWVWVRLGGAPPEV